MGIQQLLLSREVCIQVLSEYFFAKKRYVIWQDELEDELDTLEPPATRVLNWLLKTGWLRKVDDYASMTVYIVIPDYAAVMTEAFCGSTARMRMRRRSIFRMFTPYCFP